MNNMDDEKIEDACGAADTDKMIWENEDDKQARPEDMIWGQNSSDSPEESTVEESTADKSTAENDSEPVFTPDTGSSNTTTSDQGSIQPYTDSVVDEGRKKKKMPKVCKIILIMLVAVIVCTYISISVWFMFHCNYKTYINGVDYSFYTLDEIDNVITEYIKDYSLTVKTREGREYTITPDSIALDIQPNITARQIIKKQNGFLWPYYMTMKKDYDLYYTAKYDDNKLKELLHSYAFTQDANMEKPTDAYVTIQNGKSTIISETKGNYIDFDKLCVIIDEALVKGEKLLELDQTDVYAKPEITSESQSIVDEQEKLAKILELTISYSIDQVSWELTSEDYGDWIIISKDGITFSHDKIKEYVENMAARYDTYGVPRNFRTHDDRVVTLDNTWYGWKIDVEGETEELTKLLEAGESVERVPLLDCYAAVYKDDGDDIGDTYIECDFGQQHIYVYVDGELVMDSDCVSGGISNNCKTPGGVYTILYTKTPAVLIGDDYETPVKYWMPFIGELGIGFHDATWRGSFGGDIYKNSGSHGCVNLPLSAAEKLFNIAYEGMPVVCYY